MPTLPHHLLAPMQVWINDVKVNNVPRFLTDNLTDETHFIVAWDENGDRVVLPFVFNGVVSHLPIRSLTIDKWLRHGCLPVVLTSNELSWNPHTDLYQDKYDATIDCQGNIFCSDTVVRGPFMVINSINCINSVDAADITADDLFCNFLKCRVNVSSTSIIYDPTSRYGSIQSKGGNKSMLRPWPRIGAFIHTRPNRPWSGLYSTGWELGSAHPCQYDTQQMIVCWGIILCRILCSLIGAFQS